jgi:hypothetical protein
LSVFRTRHPDFSSQRVGWIPFVDKASNAFLIENFGMAEREAQAGEKRVQTEDARHL